ncbi:DUF2520 domain-containing protein [Aquimarina addita]|uniref:DUF2520 domain-containing protein n=1 Tax=Aquimarina addita TaxID=870485 RepID=A0ABP6UM18_9FLAO
MITIIILGAGNVAKHIYTAFTNQKSVRIIQCYNRKGVSIHKDQKKENITKNLRDLIEADIYIIAVSDDAISEVSDNLPFTNKLIVHTSGSVPMLSMNSVNRRGVFYPLQTFSINSTIKYSTIPFCIEAEKDTDRLLLKKLALILSPKVYDISSEQRSVLHVAAVFVNNFTNHLFSVGNQICSENEIPFEILHPLIQETAKKITVLDPDKAQTGPAIRKDNKTLQRHLHILKKDSQKELYTLLTQSIQSNYGKKL